MKKEVLLDNIIISLMILMGLIVFSRTLVIKERRYTLLAFFFLILVTIIVIGYIYTLKGSKRHGKLLFDLSITNKYERFRYSIASVFLLRIIVIILLTCFCIIFLLSDIPINTYIFPMIYTNLLLNNFHYKYAIYEKGIYKYGKFYPWTEVSGIILNTENSLELTVKGSTEVLTLYYDIKFRDEMAQLFRSKFNKNSIIDKRKTNNE